MRNREACKHSKSQGAVLECEDRKRLERSAAEIVLATTLRQFKAQLDDQTSAVIAHIRAHPDRAQGLGP